MNSFEPQQDVDPPQQDNTPSLKTKEKRLRKTNTIRLKKNTVIVEKEIPTIQNSNITKLCNYSVSELRQFLKSHNLYVSGTKKVLHDRLFLWLTTSKNAVKIQSFFRGHLVRSVYIKFKTYQGMIKDCINEQDFCSFEPLADIDKFQLICVKDPDGPVYGFDICSVCQYKRNLEFGVELTNPYTRNKFPSSFFSDLTRIVYASKHNIISTIVDIKPDPDVESLSFEKKVELRALSLFQHMNSLGNYSEASWYLYLSRRRVIRMIQELYDIWQFRLNIQQETKRAICPPTGNPFGSSLEVRILDMTDIELKNFVLGILESFVFNGVDRDSQHLGSFYVLGALSLVSSTAAEACPWLFHSFVY